MTDKRCSWCIENNHTNCTVCEDQVKWEKYMEDKVIITKKEYEELKEKAWMYDWCSK